MLAKDFIKILEKNPDLEVKVIYENLELAEWEEIPVIEEGIFISEYNPEEIIITLLSIVQEMKKEELKYIDMFTRPND